MSLNYFYCLEYQHRNEPLLFDKRTSGEMKDSHLFIPLGEPMSFVGVTYRSRNDLKTAISSCPPQYR